MEPAKLGFDFLATASAAVPESYKCSDSVMYTYKVQGGKASQVESL